MSVLWLAVAAFSIGTEAFVIAGLLPSIAADLQISLAATGQLVTAYALTYDPTVVPQMNKALVKAGITGANGYYYPPSDPVQP